MRLESLDPKHKLLMFGVVQPGNTEFYLNEQNQTEFDRRFAKGGVHPRGTNACAHALGKYFVALREAADSIENGLAASLD